MASQLIIKILGGGEIGSVVQNASGELVVQAYATEMRASLEKLVKSYGQKELTLVSGTSEVVNGQTVNRTLVKKVKRGDPDYLHALADALSSPSVQLEGKRIRGYVVR